MSITGRFYVEQTPDSEPRTEIVLELTNESDEDVQVFLPNGRSDGVVVIGPPAADPYRVSPYELPEAGLVAATPLPVGGSVSRRYGLDEWYEPDGVQGAVLRCAATVEYRAEGSGEAAQSLDVESEVLLGEVE